MTLATWIIAIATVANVIVYFCISQQIKEQISLTKDQIKLTQKLFLESHKPELSVSIEDCEYSEPDGVFEGQITFANHGATVARQVRFQIQMDGYQGRKDIGPITIQPMNRIRQQLSFPMSRDMYQRGQTVGNRLGVLIEGSFRGLADEEYQYHERQEYAFKLNRFMPFWAK
jgi:hypothetical protein